MKLNLVLLLLSISLLTNYSFSKEHNNIRITTYETLSETQQVRAQKLFYRLRCVVCEGQALAESDAFIAKDIREFVSKRIKANDSDQNITKYLEQRYGSAVTSLTVDYYNQSKLWIVLLIPLTILLAIIALFYFWFNATKKNKHL